MIKGTRVFSRRDFLKFGGLAVTGVTYIKLPFNRLLHLGRHETGWSSRIEKSVATVCQLCDSRCGLRVRTINRLPVSVSGAPDHPVNSGKLCPKGLSLLQTYYHPARIEGPRIRKGGMFHPIPWDEALERAAEKIGEARKGDRDPNMTFLQRGLGGISRRIAAEFLSKTGCGNLVSLDRSEAIRLANYCGLGHFQHYSFDLGNADLILSFGSELLGAWESPLFAQGAIATMREKRKDAMLIHVGPRHSTTASRADEWIPVRPGTEGAFALGIAYVLLKEELYDEEFIENHTFGFDDLPLGEKGVKGFRDFVLEKYHPDYVSRITGATSEQIIRTAKAFAGTRASVAVFDDSMTRYTNGFTNALTVNALNALAGNIDRPGGLLKQRHYDYHGNRFGTAECARATDRIPFERWEGTESRERPDILLLYNVNPCYSSPQPGKFKKWLESVPFKISFSNCWDETAEACDLVLPEHHFLDRWEDAGTSEVFPYLVVGLSQPVVEEPLFDTRHIADVLHGIGSKLGLSIGGKKGASFSIAEEVKGCFRNIYESKRGTVFTDRFKTEQIKKLAERGWWSDHHGSFDRFWRDLREKGGWWDPAYTHGEWGRVFNTPSRKFEFYSQNLSEGMKSLTAKSGFPARSDTSAVEIPFPHFEKGEQSGSPSEYPFHLVPFESISFNNGTGGDVPWLIEKPSSRFDILWDTWIGINASTAAELGVKDGEKVTVESPHGKITAVAKLTTATAPNVVEVPLGMGRKSFHKDIPSAGSNPMEIVSPLKDVFSGTPALGSTMVKVYKR
jgi:anaerobic selenocysteine-containing dehydrogenase